MEDWLWDWNICRSWNLPQMLEPMSQGMAVTYKIGVSTCDFLRREDVNLHSSKPLPPEDVKC